MTAPVFSRQVPVTSSTSPDDTLVQRYNALAPRWQQIIARLGYPHAYTGLMARLKQDGWLASLTPAARVLDCGIGSGALSVALLRQQPVQQIDGVDVAPGMLTEAQRYVAAAGAALQAHRNDMRALPFADATFDLLLSAHTLEHLPDPLPGLREMLRVLRPGAPLILIITRPGLGGTLIQARWGIRRIPPHSLQRRLIELGVTPICRYELTIPWCRHCSYVLVGLKQRLSTSWSGACAREDCLATHAPQPIRSRCRCDRNGQRNGSFQA